MKYLLQIILIAFLFNFGASETKVFSKTRYEPTWESLDQRPLPEWYDDAKFGIFIHWGVYSVPGYGSEWFWNNWKDNASNYVEFMKNLKAPGFTYQQFAPDFTAHFFNATRWAEIFHKANAKYVVLTSKHHEGFTLWPSKCAFSWNAQDIGPHRDIISELSHAVRAKNIHFGVYYSLYEWFNPMYLEDKDSEFKNQRYVNEKMLPELHELIYNYEPDVIWTDGDWEAKDDYWKSKDFLAWLFNESPIKDKVIVNDRWGSDIPCHHGGVYTCTDRYNPGILQKHKWENCMTIDKKSWGFRKNAELQDYKTLHELIEDLVTTVSCGGNLLMNVGPTSEGMIAPIYQDRLQGLGEWLDINGEGIFNTTPWIYQNDSLNKDVWYTTKKDIKSNEKKTVYAIVLKWPEDNLLILRDIIKTIDSDNSQIYMLGYGKSTLSWKKLNNVEINFPDMSKVNLHSAWVLKITNILKN